MTCCIARLTAVIPTQQVNPSRIGFPPFLTSEITSVFMPIAAIAMIIKNLLSDLKGLKTLAEMPQLVATVVITEAATKNRMKNGNIFLKE